ncbi:hypothetical protein RJ641_036834, partial [Dillenia turbinata]
TCLSKGGGFYFPPCHMLSVCGFQILVDCPLDLSALTIFSPVPVDSFAMQDEGNCLQLADRSLDSEYVNRNRLKVEKPINAKDLIHAEPWFKTVRNLHLWSVSSIDIVLITSWMGMLGLPFLTRMKEFSAKIYVTEATARIAHLMMKDLLSMHMEFREFYGWMDSGFPEWMRWTQLEMLPLAISEIVLGQDWTNLGGFMPLYSAVDVKDCMQKVQSLKYGEEACYNGTIIMKAFSSGLEIGASNWIIAAPEAKLSCMSNSAFKSSHAMSFDYQTLQGTEILVCSNTLPEDAQDDNHSLALMADDSMKSSCHGDCLEKFMESLINANKSTEEMEKLSYVCSCAADSVKAGGSVLIPMGQLGLTLQLLEQISSSLEAISLEVPIYIISSIAEELLAFTNIIPEWLCQHRQDKLYSGEPLFAHVELLKQKRLHLFPALHSPELILRLGPVVHLLQRWQNDPNSLIVLENGVDADLALLPFKPITIKVLQCSFVSAMKFQTFKPMLNMLQPKYVLRTALLPQQFPDDLRWETFCPENPFTCRYYSENETVPIPSLNSTELEITTGLASQLHCKSLKQESMNIARLKGELIVEHGKHRLDSSVEPVQNSNPKPLLRWGLIDLKRLLALLKEMGISGSLRVSPESHEFCIADVNEPSKALIELQGNKTIVSTADEKLALLISDAIDCIADSI